MIMLAEQIDDYFEKDHNSSLVIHSFNYWCKLVGIYQGTVEESTARMVLRADRTATAQPDINRPNRKLTGKWKVAKDTIEVALTNQENETGTVILEIVGANLRLAKVISPDGEVEEHDAILKRQK